MPSVWIFRSSKIPRFTRSWIEDSCQLRTPLARNLSKLTGSRCQNSQRFLDPKCFAMKSLVHIFGCVPEKLRLTHPPICFRNIFETRNQHKNPGEFATRISSEEFVLSPRIRSHQGGNKDGLIRGVSYKIGEKPLKFNMESENQPLEMEIPNLETIIFRFHVKLWGCIMSTGWGTDTSVTLLFSGNTVRKTDMSDYWMVSVYAPAIEICITKLAPIPYTFLFTPTPSKAISHWKGMISASQSSW